MVRGSKAIAAGQLQATSAQPQQRDHVMADAHKHGVDEDMDLQDVPWTKDSRK